MKNCKHCNQEFEPNHGKQLFCSDACKMAHHRSDKNSGTVKGVLHDLLPSVDAKTGNVIINWRPVWVTEFDSFFEKEGITPEKMLAEYVEMKKQKTSEKLSINKIIQAGDKHESKKEYDPFKDPTFKAKIGIKDK